jgi:hypothetical protein
MPNTLEVGGRPVPEHGESLAKPAHASSSASSPLWPKVLVQELVQAPGTGLREGRQGQPHLFGGGFLGFGIGPG